jgi:hypothetical protein
MKMYKDCSICKYCDEDLIFDEETGEEHPFYICQKGNDTSFDYECKDFERYWNERKNQDNI